MSKWPTLKQGQHNPIFLARFARTSLLYTLLIQLYLYPSRTLTGPCPPKRDPFFRDLPSQEKGPKSLLPGGKSPQRLPSPEREELFKALPSLEESMSIACSP